MPALQPDAALLAGRTLYTCYADVHCSLCSDLATRCADYPVDMRAAVSSHQRLLSPSEKYCYYLLS